MPAKTLGDTMLRAHVSTLPVPEFAETAWTPAPPLSEARVAVVTTAALHPEGGEALTGWATNYSVLDASTARAGPGALESELRPLRLHDRPQRGLSAGPAR